jgi:hypothetical protein
MHADSNHPGLRKYRAARERDRQRAILRSQIKTANPTLTPVQVEQVMSGHLKAQQVSNVVVRSRNGQPHRVEVKKV